MAADTIDATLEEIGEWASGRSVTPNLDEIGFMLELSRDHLGHSSAADFRPGEFNELLLGVYPAEVTFSSEQDAADIVDAARQLVAFLADAKGFRDEQVREFAAELDEIEPVLTAAIVEGLDESSGLLSMLEQLGV